MHNDFQAIGVVGTIPVVWYVLCHEEVLNHGERQPKSKSTWRIVKVTHRVKMIWTHSESMNKGYLYYATTICLLHAFWFSHKLVSFYVCIKNSDFSMIKCNKCFCEVPIYCFYILIFDLKLHQRGYSSVVEHSTADREVHGSTPCAP